MYPIGQFRITMSRELMRSLSIGGSLTPKGEKFVVIMIEESAMQLSNHQK